MNRDSKTKGGMTGFKLCKGAVNRWVLAHHERAGISHACKNLAGKDETYRTRSEIDNARMMKDEFCENQLKTSDVDYHAPLNFSFLFS